ncbi:alpha/beta fold hydrolase [Novosphingobium decolorationis]|uniref:Alpha/beta hydrolase n=1 Tax=Novosphingobium decolorationis TaxID=2698673 RepID=A0ABX8E6V6_9SPHN|nr:alpha/beta hydrolase [Novosphingobium decolorationis]QVM84712.1 alpha/beta hydrolase [Novosphingobium decolorationis]
MTRWAARGYADGPYGQIHYRHEGQGLPIVLLHQAPMTSAQYDRVLEPLARRGFHAVAIDMPGFGMSDPVEGTPRVEDWAACVPPVLDALGHGSATILGHHTGALVATEVALQFPDRVRALVLNGPMPLTEEERAEFLANGYPRERTITAQADGGQFAAVHAARTRLAAGTVEPERVSEYVVMAFQGQGAYWHGHHAAFQYRQEETLAAIACPALILTNTGDIIHDHALKARELRPDFAWVALDGGGVDIVDQQPEAWAQTVADFVQSL